MKRLLVVLLVLPLAVFSADEPANVTVVRDQFIASVIARGLDPKRCTLTFVETIEQGHIIDAHCEQLPQRCLLIVHPTKALVAPLQCIENPEFVPEAPASKT